MKVLLIQLRRIGDLVLTTPAIEAIRGQIAGAEISLAIKPEAAPLLPAIGGIHRAFIAGSGAGLRVIREIRRSAFDCVIDFTRNDRSAALTALSGARRRIVSNRLRRKSRFRAFFYNEFVDCAMKEMHTVDYHLALLRPLGIEAAPIRLVLTLPEGVSNKAGRLCAEQWDDEQFAIFHPGSARADKFWEPRRWAEIIAFAAERLKMRPVLTAGPSAIETAHLAEIRRELRVPVVDLGGRVDLLTLTALIARASLLVTVDSAPMHLASALRTPQVVLFGPTNPFHWRPRDTPAFLLRGRSPEPLRKFQAVTPRLSTSLISTAAVIDAMRSMMSAPAASAV